MILQSPVVRFHKALMALLIVMAGGLALTAAVVVGLLALFALADPFGDAPHPGDAAMLEQFHRQRAALEELLAMIGTDEGVERLAPDFTRPEPPPLTDARLADYRSRLDAAGIRRGFSHYGDEVVFIVSTRGLAISGSAKGFLHAARAPDDAVVVDGDLDDAAAPLARQDPLLVRRIAGDWWLMLDMR